MPISRHPLSGPFPSLPGVRVDPAAAQRLRESLAQLAPRGTDLTRDFYDALFARYPGVRVLFPTDMKAQEAKLFDSLRMVVESLDDAPAVRAKLAELGRRHDGYGAKPDHYPIVCSLLLETLAKSLGPAWTAELAAEWAQALQLVSDAMQGGVQMAPAGAPTGMRTHYAGPDDATRITPHRTRHGEPPRSA